MKDGETLFKKTFLDEKTDPLLPMFLCVMGWWGGTSDVVW